MFILQNIDKDLNIYFSNYYQNLFQQIYLNKFFVNITTLGDSLWYILISVLFIVIFYILKKINFLNKYKKIIDSINYYNFLLFFSILTSGIITQIIKHIVGRPRPNTFIFENEINYKFFTLDSNFHSFPSGHTATIFAVAMVCILAIPKLKYFFLFFSINYIV